MFNVWMCPVKCIGANIIKGYFILINMFKMEVTATVINCLSF